MGLQAQVPSGMRQHVFDGGCDNLLISFRVAGVAGLQTIDVSLKQCLVGEHILTLIHYLQLVGMLNGNSRK